MKIFNFWKNRNSKSQGKKADKAMSNEKHGQFGVKELSISEENRWKIEIFDTAMNPREWMARFGHNILVGDYRIYKYRDKEFEKWIHQAFEALVDEGLEKLWNEFLTEEEIAKVREAYKNF